MSITNPAKHLPRASRRPRGPEFAFAGTLLSTIFFVLACLVALVASLRDRACEQSRMTYWDVAGALTLFGICVASQVDAEQMVRLVEGTHHRH